eukprot:15479450-Alexandrium_andersonii.AAC.1
MAGKRWLGATVRHGESMTNNRQHGRHRFVSRPRAGKAPCEGCNRQQGGTGGSAWAKLTKVAPTAGA